MAIAAAVLSIAPVVAPPAVAAGNLAVGSLPAAPAFRPPWATSVRDEDAPDPDIVRFGDRFYAYTTGTTWGNHIGILVSSRPDSGWNTVTGTASGSSAFPAIGPARSVRPWQVNNTQHAPGVFAIGGRYVMYYTARTTSGHGGHYCLSIATATRPEGPFTDATSGPWLCRDADGGAIDPAPFVDASGDPWLVFKTYDDVNTTAQPAKILAVPLSSDGLHTAGATRVLIAQNQMSSPFETVENPQMTRVGDQYVLVFSRGLYTSSAYRQGDATCDGPGGPCREMTSSLVTSYGAVIGPGGGTTFTDASGQWWLAYGGWNAPCHAYNGTACARRLYIAPLTARAPIHCDAVTNADGYRMVASDGGVFGFGNEPFCGSTGGIALHQPIVGIAPTPDRGGYWLAASDGGVFAFGDARFYGSTGAQHLNQPVVAIVATPTGHGYWFVARDGGVFPFGDARFYGSTGSIRLARPIVGMAATPSGHGYWLVASDGGVFAFGDARFSGSTGALRLNRPIVGMAATPSGHGYWFVASDGGVFAFGDAAFHGSTGALRLNRPIVGMAATPSGHGYWFVASDGGVFAFGDAAFHGSTGALRLTRPIVGVAA